MDPNRTRGNLRVMGDTLVDRVIFEGSRAVAVSVNTEGAQETIYAPTIILAGGTYNSPTILMRSGVGSADELREHGIAVVLDLPGVGKNLHDHPAVTLRMSGTDELKRELTSWAESAWFPEVPRGADDRQASIIPLRGGLRPPHLPRGRSLRRRPDRMG
ncbi:GMC family oxidoreductase N-terminal domain-containing protein, partial [Escherichia coli]|uniref:GMC family oxidoreductase N-terminal domain-containing protein n=1 Tax=Escherichia coli TaxID=562 RepID=UPI002157C188